MQLSAKEQRGSDERHEHCQEESENVQEAVPLDQDQLSLQQEQRGVRVESEPNSKRLVQANMVQLNAQERCAV